MAVVGSESQSRRAAAAIMESHWRPPGFTCPHPRTYPWQWLWDSCFHAVIWCELGRSDRALGELGTVLSHQSRGGFVPHMTYHGAPETATGFWGRPATSSITQPPMYGHAIAELVRRGVEVPEPLVDRARSGLAFLLERRRRSAAGLIELVHPWESGADDSPRWDHFAGAAWSRQRWRERKGELLATVERDERGDPVANPGFAVGSAAFSALVAFNALELAGVSGDGALGDRGRELAVALDRRWDRDVRTWVDDGESAASSGRARTLDALLGLLVSGDPIAVDAVLADVVDPAAFGARFGPTGVHRDEPTFDRRAYWRGAAWPQLTYLLAIAASRVGADGVAARLGEALAAGAVRSGWAEHWDADTAEGGGAVPQSWTCLALCVGSADEPAADEPAADGTDGGRDGRRRRTLDSPHG